MRKFSTLYCGIKGGFVKECLLRLGHEKENACDGCRYQTPIYRKYRFIQHGPDPRLEIDTNKVKLSFDLPEPKRSHSRLPKKFFVTDRISGEQRRMYRADHQPRGLFTSTLCFRCDETVKQEQKIFCKEKGYNLGDLNIILNNLKDKERHNLTLRGRQRFLDRRISQIMKDSRMKPFRHLTSRTLSEWRREHCGNACMKHNPILKIKIGRPGKE